MIAIGVSTRTCVLLCTDLGALRVAGVVLRGALVSLVSFLRLAARNTGSASSPRRASTDASVVVVLCTGDADVLKICAALGVISRLGADLNQPARCEGTQKQDQDSDEPPNGIFHKALKSGEKSGASNGWYR